MTASVRKQFLMLSALVVLVGFTLGSLLSPPDPVSQLRITGGLVAVGLVGSYLLVYKSTVDCSWLRWDDLFRWIVSTYVFVILLGFPLLLIAPDDGPAALGFQLGLLVVSAGLARIVVWSDSIRWPGDR
jgi:uncharacterized membrane protein HdeD (DUF308 family)